MTADGLGGMAEVRKSELADGSGRRYDALRPSWTPRFGVVWLHILGGYLGLLAIGWLCWQVPGDASAALLASQVVGGALGFGYVHAYLQLFMHEAAHHNIAPTREANDWLANLVIGSWVGLAIEAYRPIHFAHHRHLGTTRDTERSYFTALTGRLIAESLTGVHVLRVLLGRLRHSSTQQDESVSQRQGSWWPLVQGLLMHGIIVTLALQTGRYAFVGAWVLGIVTAFPFFATLRQIIEHRRLDAPGDVDFASSDHGEVNRLFGDGPLASSLGGAGFNRHMLHHWDPQLSYTRLHDLERFLMGTSVAPLLDSARTTYPETFLALLRAPRMADAEWQR